MGTRVILAIVLVVACTLLGRAMGNALRRRVTLLDNLIEGVKMLRLHMSGMLERVSDALAATNCSVFVETGREMEAGLSAHAAWEKIMPDKIARGGELDALSGRDRDIIGNLFDNLGEVSRREKEIIIHGIIKQIYDQREGAKMQLSERERLYTSVGFLLGLMFAIAVI